MTSISDAVLSVERSLNDRDNKNHQEAKAFKYSVVLSLCTHLSIMILLQGRLSQHCIPEYNRILTKYV